MPALDPIGSASWIWLSQPGPGVNEYACFRRTFELRRRPGRAPLAISVDSDFVLWVNGEQVGMGQFSDWPDRRTITRYDVSKHLRVGSNTVAVLAYHRGEDFSCHKAGPAGLWLTLRAGATQVVTDAAWKGRLHPAYRSGPIDKVTVQLAYTFEFDARRDDHWIGPAVEYDADGSISSRGGYSDRDWPDASIVASGSPALVERPISARRFDVNAPVRIAAQGQFIRTSREGSIARVMGRDALVAVPPWDAFVNPEFALGDAYTAQPVRPTDFLRSAMRRYADLAPPAPGFDGRYLIIDLEQEEVGLLDLDLDAPAGTRVEIAHGEHLDDGRVRAHVGGRNFADAYVCREGLQHFTHYFRRFGARYLQIHFSAFSRPIRVGYIGLLARSSPVPVVGSFSCGDALAERSFEIGVRTLDLCMHDHYEDCPWREQSLYGYDSRNQALFGYYVTGNYAFAATSFDLLGRGLRPDLLLELCAPAKIPITIPLFSLAWIVEVAEHLLFSGDDGLVRRFGPQMLQMIEGFIANFDEGVGLVRAPEGAEMWNFYEWSDGLASSFGEPVADRFDAPLNLYVHEALGLVAGLMERFGHGRQAGELRRGRRRLGKAIHEAFWDPQRRRYATYLRTGRREHYAQLTQALALHEGVVPARERGEVARAIGDPALVGITLGSMLYAVRALMRSGPSGRRLAAERVRRQWEPMVMSGATSFWETARGSDDFSLAGSLCHGWSAMPVYWGQACVLGVEPLEPGFASFQVRPWPDRFAQANGKVPTPVGALSVAWERSPRGLLVEARGPRSLRPVFRAWPEAPIARATWNGRAARVSR